MTILSEVLEKVKNDPLDAQMKVICDEIQKEEEEKFKVLKDKKPVGPNIFLSISVPNLTKNELNFLCLEREFPGVYITSLWSKIGDKSIKRIKTWECKENSSQKILEFYSKTLKFIKGE